MKETDIPSGSESVLSLSINEVDYLNAKADYERAAEFYNACRKAGIQGSQIDFLICSVSVGNKIPIFTSDKDFLHYKKELPISLYQPRKR
jgi:predicted nucleic acid-binding protein